MTHTDTNYSTMPADHRPTSALPISPGCELGRRVAIPDRYESSQTGAFRRIGWKRATDILLALLMIAFFLPAFIAIAVCLLVQDGWPLIFSQQRIGRGGRTFSCYKFRSMPRNADILLKQLLDSSPARRAEWETTHKLEKDPRIHWFGRILRRSSLDELPQLFNVLRGEMSIVGPRPIVREEIAKYGSKFEAYQSVRPGLTGLWQVSGRNRLSYEQRVELDEKYSKNVSFERDLTILLATIRIVLLARGDF